MNWGAGLLILLGVGIVVMGVAGSQKTVCQALTGGDCTWLPGSSSSSSSSSNSGSGNSSSGTGTGTITPYLTITPQQGSQMNQHIVGL